MKKIIIGIAFFIGGALLFTSDNDFKACTGFIIGIVGLFILVREYYKEN